MSEETECNWRSTSETDNLTSLTELNQKTLLAAIQKRYMEDKIYTDVGDILVAVNPFCSLPLYSSSCSAAFSQPDQSGMAPHIFKTAARAYNAMVQAKQNQVCVISGESGAGKTESAKLIMKQVMTMCRSSGVGQSLQHKITQLNPILEAFGNAKTALNDNSSRFGKFIQLIFEPNGRIDGAGLEQYLLEKSRICVQGEEERNFHIFYYLYSGLGEDKLHQLHLKKPTEHRYLKKYPQVTQECSSSHNKEMLGIVAKSMEDIGFKAEEIEDIYSILSAVILIGDVDFEGADGGDDNSTIKNPESVECVSKILQLESAEELSFALTTLRTETRGETVDQRYKCSKAFDVRDALAKALYSRLFQWIVTRLNSYLQPYPSPDHLTIGILDIFGFENFERNSFEQFCINLANEQLQCYFNHQIFAMEKAELMKEGLENLGDIQYTDNEPVLDLFVSKPIGLLSLLDEQCRGLNGTEKAFVQRCKDSFRKHPNFIPDKGSSLQFTIQHYAGRVLYKIQGFLEKNKDSLPEMLVDAVKYGKVKLLRALFRRPAVPNSELRKSVLRKSQRSIMRAMSRKSFRKVKQRGKPQKMLTVGGHFQQSLKELMERIFSASPQFVRCIKPNYAKKPKLCDDDFMLKQLTYTGMLEAVRVRREGFSYRPYFSDFFNSYRCLAYNFTDTEIRGSEAACQVILKKAGLEGWQLGKSRVFLRYFHEEKLHLMLKDFEDKAILIQKIYRGWITRKNTDAMRERQKREKIMATQFLTLMDSHGKECVEKLISLTKTDILLSKERFKSVPAKAVSRFTPLSSRESYKNLSAAEKRVRKARQFGVQLMPGMGSAGHTSTDDDIEEEEIDEELTDDESTPEDDPSPPTDNGHTPSPSHNVTPTNENHTSSQQVPPLSEDNSPSSSPPNTPTKPHPVPHPRGPCKATPTAPASDSPRAPPVPLPRTRINGVRVSVELDKSPYDSSSSSTKGGANAVSSNGLSPEHKPVPKPRRKKPSKSSSSVSDINSKNQEEDIDGPRRRSNPEGQIRSHLANQLSDIRRSQAEDDRTVFDETSEEVVYCQVSTDIRTGQVSDIRTDQVSDIRTGQVSESRTSQTPGIRTSQVSDLRSQWEAGNVGKNTRSQSDTSGCKMAPVGQSRANRITNSSEAQSSMSQNITNLRLRANSNASSSESGGNDQEAGLNGRAWSVGSNPSSSGSPSPSHVKPGAPMADKRVKKKRWRLGSSSRESSPPPTMQMDDDNSLDILGFYSTFNQDKATDYIQGQPQGTYMLYKDDEQNLVLIVSLGRLGVKMYPVVPFIGRNGAQSTAYYLGNIERARTQVYPHIRGLLEHYKSEELSAGLKLSHPRLLAGVLVKPLQRNGNNGVLPQGRLHRLAQRRKS